MVGLAIAGAGIVSNAIVLTIDVLKFMIFLGDKVVNYFSANQTIQLTQII